MKCTLTLIVLAKTKETIRYCESHAIGDKVALNTISIDLMQVSVPAEDGSNMPLVDQHFHAHSCP
jgi:hypothetical protein